MKNNSIIWIMNYMQRMALIKKKLSLMLISLCRLLSSLTQPGFDQPTLRTLMKKTSLADFKTIKDKS
ncbi:MAG: hypothetical protein ACLRL6_07835 [Clostridium sp.]